MKSGNQQGKNEGGLSPLRRWSGLYTVGLMILLLLFFAIHQRRDTGFFTSQFGTAEMVALYLPILVSMAAPILRAILGRAEPARLVEAISDVCIALGSLWLRYTFPFNFAHIADIFPPTIHFAFTWINDNIGRLILLLQIIIGFISALATFGGYLTDHWKRLEETERS